MAKAHLLIHRTTRTVNSAWHSKADAEEYAKYYNRYREFDAQVEHREFDIGTEKERPQVPGWYCEINIASAQIVLGPSVSPWPPENRPKHIVASNDHVKIGVISFESAEHARWAAGQERHRYLRKQNGDKSLS